MFLSQKRTKMARTFFSDKTLSLLLLCYSSAHASLKCVCEPLYASGNHTLIGSKIKSFKVRLEITKTSWFGQVRGSILFYSGLAESEKCKNSDFVVLAYKMKIDTLMFMNGQIVLLFINEAKKDISPKYLLRILELWWWIYPINWSINLKLKEKLLQLWMSLIKVMPNNHQKLMNCKIPNHHH